MSEYHRDLAMAPVYGGAIVFLASVGGIWVAAALAGFGWFAMGVDMALRNEKRRLEEKLDKAVER